MVKRWLILTICSEREEFGQSGTGFDSGDGCRLFHRNLAAS
ncbi:hypothetical protein BV133_2523 [Blastochloris viridis]|uniref:Uncharacterized protein n=1 Tax=Blastochloris viridis TaxID=1079 RepID=A0A182D3P0_BLAVI|nr:hypothetical protein BV133_2523 [Blastochloris viridis]